MMAQQNEFTVEQISVREKTATLDTRETWVYWWFNVITGATTKTEETVTYHIRYHFVQEDERWKVDNIESIQ
jgi:hypothetical protein